MATYKLRTTRGVSKKTGKPYTLKVISPDYAIVRTDEGEFIMIDVKDDSEQPLPDDWLAEMRTKGQIPNNDRSVTFVGCDVRKIQEH